MGLIHINKNPRPLGSTNTKNLRNFKKCAQQHEESQRHNPICGNCGLQHAKKQCPHMASNAKTVGNSTTSTNGAEVKSQLST